MKFADAKKAIDAYYDNMSDEQIVEKFKKMGATLIDVTDRINLSMNLFNYADLGLNHYKTDSENSEYALAS